MNITGILKTVFETKQVSPTFSTREFVVETPEQYPQLILFQLAQDKCDLIDSYAEGEEIIVDFNVRGRSWTNPQGEVKYFNTLQCWKIQRANLQLQNSAEFEPPKPHAGEQFLGMNNDPKEVKNIGSDEDELDDLPF